MKYSPLFLLLLFGCSKKNKEFTLKTVTLNSHRALTSPSEPLRIRFLDGADTQHILATTAAYPASLPLPAVLSVHPAFQLPLYKHPFFVQLWGDSTGLIGTAELDMDDYKIIFPLEMEIKGADLDVTVSGGWGG